MFSMLATCEFSVWYMLYQVFRVLLVSKFPIIKPQLRLVFVKIAVLHDGDFGPPVFGLAEGAHSILLMTY